jgi:hypothetical protein
MDTRLSVRAVPGRLTTRRRSKLIDEDPGRFFAIL